MEATQNKLLIAFSKGFINSKLFRRKINKFFTAESQKNLSVDVMQDEASIASNHFKAHGVEVNSVGRFSRSECKRHLVKYDFVVVFWDGDDLTQIVHSAKILGVPMRLVSVLVTKVRNKKNNEEFDVYIGRGTPWGNPFPIDVTGVGDDRTAVIEKYRRHFYENILTDPKMNKAIRGLSGAKLGCSCSPLPCHGDVIAEYLNSLDDADDSDDS